MRGKKRKDARAAQAISSSALLGGAKPNQINLTGSRTVQKAQEKDTARRENKSSSTLEKTTLFPLGVKPFIPSRDKDEEETQLLALGHFITQQDKDESDKFTTGAVMSRDDQDTLLDNWDEDWITGQESPGNVDLDYSSDKCEEGPDNALVGG